MAENADKLPLSKDGRSELHDKLFGFGAEINANQKRSDEEPESQNSNVILYASGIRNSSDANARKNRFNALKNELNSIFNIDYVNYDAGDVTLNYDSDYIGVDEYGNYIVRFGHWKDTGVRLYGEGVWSLTCMFLEMWRICNEKGGINASFPVPDEKGLYKPLGIWNVICGTGCTGTA